MEERVEASLAEFDAMRKQGDNYLEKLHERALQISESGSKEFTRNVAIIAWLEVLTKLVTTKSVDMDVQQFIGYWNIYRLKEIRDKDFKEKAVFLHKRLIYIVLSVAAGILNFSDRVNLCQQIFINRNPMYKLDASAEMIALAASTKSQIVCNLLISNCDSIDTVYPSDFFEKIHGVTINYNLLRNMATQNAN
jgi:hypothetical protein